MAQDHFDQWLRALGYDPASPSLHRPSSALASRHAYAPELHDLLSPQGQIRAEAVFDVEGLPTVGFFLDDGSLLCDEQRLTELRERVWNQGLLSVLLVVSNERLVPVPVAPKREAGDPLPFSDARPDGSYSRADVQSGDIRERHPTWFRLEDRVDRKLVANLRETVAALTKLIVQGRPYPRRDAQYLVGQVLFVSYLEHRGIVGVRYRETREVGAFKQLVDGRNRHALERLLGQLKHDFNGDFLDREAGLTSVWVELPDAGFDIISDFLSATDMARRQPSFFPYNFRYIPVELLSGIYESFLGKDDKKKLAAYYTPRHLANLVVDQAFSESKDLLAERIYDGACGSGILLTTAFRRLLGETEARQGGRHLSLRERIALLKEHIFGSDISEAACRVTAFSLYLSLLERLDPSDVAALCDDEQVKLPVLQGINLFGGDRQGDFFSPDNPHTQRRDFTLFLSNPPWNEVDLESHASLQAWADRHDPSRVLNQIAADFAWQASEVMAEGARLCFILPMSLMLKPTSQEFISLWLERMSLYRLINFGDLKELLFDDGTLSCIVVLAQRRPPVIDATESAIRPTETFEYWAPKADLSLVFGRLTLHGVDRHEVQTASLAHSNRELVTRMWGDGFDLALWARLRLRGTFGDLLRGKQKRWRKQKGFHREDAQVKMEDRVSSERLHQWPFIRPGMLYDAVVLDPATDAEPFPVDEIPMIPRLSDGVMAGFQGPRILFPDGSSPERSIRATFVAAPASFMSSVGAIVGSADDEDLLRFATVYLRSDLVRYFLVTQLYQLLGDRDRVSLADIAEFPFYPPERHSNPDMAHHIVGQIASMTRALEETPALMRAQQWAALRGEAEVLLQTYFGLSSSDQAIVKETVASILPIIRPRGISSVIELSRRRIDEAGANAYAATLRSELEGWRDARGGQGNFQVDVMLTNEHRAGPFGIARIRISDGRTSPASSQRSDSATYKVVEQLFRDGLLPVETRERIYFMPDAVIQAGDTVYLIKPQTERLWLQRQARRDAERIVLSTIRPIPKGQAAA